MSFFKEQTRSGNMYDAAVNLADESFRVAAPSISEKLDYQTKYDQMEGIVQNIDMDNPATIKDAYSKIFKIDPKEASAFMQEMQPIMDMHGAPGDQYTKIQNDARAIAQYELSCDYNNPECAKKAAEILQSRKRPSPSETFGTEYSKESAKNLAQWDSEQEEEEKVRNAALGNIKQQRYLIQEGINQGFFADWKTLASEILGMDVTSEQAFLATIRRDNLNDLQAMSGSVSDKDIELVQQASLRSTNSREGNIMILKIKEAFLQNQAQQAKAVEMWRDSNPNATYRDMRKFKRDWAQNNPVGLATRSEFQEFRTGKYTESTEQASHADSVDAAMERFNELELQYGE